MAASSRAAVLQSPAAGACPAEAACRSPGAACRAAAGPTAAFVAARALGLLQKPSQSCQANE